MTTLQAGENRVNEQKKEITVQGDSLSELVFNALKQAGATATSSQAHTLSLESNPVILDNNDSSNVSIYDGSVRILLNSPSLRKRNSGGISMNAFGGEISMNLFGYLIPLQEADGNNSNILLERKKKLLNEFGGDRWIYFTLKEPEQNLSAPADIAQADIKINSYDYLIFPRTNDLELQGDITPELTQQIKSIYDILGIKHPRNAHPLPKSTRQWFSKGPSVEEQFLAYQEAQRQGWKNISLYSSGAGERKHAYIAEHHDSHGIFVYLSFSTSKSSSLAELEKTGEFIEYNLGIPFSERIWKANLECEVK